jgi:hypothetical protein
MTSTKFSLRRTTGAVVIGVTCAAFVAPALIAAPADAATTTSSAGSAYATPLTALHGQTLAEYLAAHHAADPRLRAHF